MAGQVLFLAPALQLVEILLPGTVAFRQQQEHQVVLITCGRHQQQGELS